MKSIGFAVTTAIVFSVSAFAQKPDSSDQQKAIAAAVKDLQAQQVKLSANQAQIDAKLVTLGEALRQARIYTSRAGH